MSCGHQESQRRSDTGADNREVGEYRVCTQKFSLQKAEAADLDYKMVWF